MKKTKKLFAALLAALLCVTALPFYALAAEEPDLDANTGITVGGSVYDFKGSGTEEDPYFYEFPYRKSSQDSLTIYTNNPAATANGETSEWTTALEYGWNEIYITVVSSDKSATAYYHLRWSRTKQQRTEKLKAGDAYTQPATNADSADGKILALDPAETYEWCVNGTNEWTSVSGVSEITGLAPGTYQLRYGESATHQGNSGSDNIKVFVGRLDQPYEIINDSGYEIECDEVGYAGARIDVRINLGSAKYPISDIDAKYRNYFSGGMSTTVGAKYYVDSYETVEGVTYANAYLMIDTYNAYTSSSTLTIESVKVMDAEYYTIEKADGLVADTTITPDNEDDVITVKNQLLYKSGSSVTIALAPKTAAGVEKINSFKVCLANGDAVAESADGGEVKVTVTGDLHIAGIDAVYTPADFTAMEEQLARIKGVDLTLYTDDTRVVLEDELALAEQMYKLHAKDQKLVDEFVPQLKAAIDGLVPKDGIFTGIEENQALIPGDGSVYTDESWNALLAAAEAAQTAIDEKWNRLRQDEIDALAADLAAAIKALEYKPADYTAVDEAIAAANALNKDDYKDFSAVEAAIAAVDRTKNITEQAAVDDMAKAINDAVAALEKAPQQTDGKDTSKTSPDTGAALMLPAMGAMLASAAAIALLKKRRED